LGKSGYWGIDEDCKRREENVNGEKMEENCIIKRVKHLKTTNRIAQYIFLAKCVFLVLFLSK